MNERADVRRTILANPSTGEVELTTNDDRVRSTWYMKPDVARSVARELTIAADILSDVAPGLDPTPAALARQVLSAAEEAVVGDSSIRGRAFCKVSGPLVGETRLDEDAAFIITTCNAAETLARAVVEGCAEAYARGRVGGAEAEKKAGVAVYESREAWAKRAEAAEARVSEDTELLKSLEWAGWEEDSQEKSCPCCATYFGTPHKGNCALAKRLARG